MRLLSYIHFIAIGIATTAASTGLANTITFDEVPDGTQVNGLSIGTVSFATFDPNAHIGVGPGVTAFTSDPSLQGSVAASLTLTFATAVNDLEYGYALNTSLDVIDATFAEVFNTSGHSLGVFSGHAFLAGFSFPSGQISISGVGEIGSAVITFRPVTNAYALDNLRFTQVPGPNGLALFILFTFNCRRHRY